MLKYRLRRLRKNFRPNTETTLKHRRINTRIEEESTNIINLVGYIILLMATLDYSFLLISSQLSDPTLAYNTAGKLVENVWGFLLGLSFIFYRRDGDIVELKESWLLKTISWLILLLGISYFSIAPVIVGNGFRLYRNTQAQAIAQLDLQKTQVEQYTQQLQSASTEQLGSLLQKYSPEQTTAQIRAGSTEKIKSDLLAQVEQQQLLAQEEITTKFGQQKQELLKTTLKWFIGAIASGTCFILIWRYTKWARTRTNN